MKMKTQHSETSLEYINCNSNVNLQFKEPTLKSQKSRNKRLSNATQ